MRFPICVQTHRVKMLYFLSYGYYKALNSKSDLQPHSRSLAFMLFDSSYMISY